jgi:protein TonB
MWHNAVSEAMERQVRQPAVANTDHGHVAVHVEGLHASEPMFSFEHRQSSVGVGSSIAAHVVFIVVGILIATYAPAPAVRPPVVVDIPTEKIVWLAEPGPGGGGGGGGNRMPEPPRKAEIPGKEAISVPVKPKPAPQPKLPELEAPETPEFNIPAKTLGDASDTIPGLLETQMASVEFSRGTGEGTGAGTGQGAGIGSGRGSGLGEGEGGGTGGGYYRPGNGVELPRVLREVRPQYTADAMRAKVQGTVLLDCVVLPDGSVGDVTVTRSLDSVFGLDQEAVKAAKQWRFVPGTRFGKPVPVMVTIELTFTLR